MATPLGGEGLPPGAEIHDPLQEAVDALALSSGNFYDACGAYARRPGDKAGNAIDEMGTRYSTASDEFLLALADGMSVEHYLTAAMTFLMDQDIQRVNKLNGLLGTDKLQKMDTKPNIADEIEDLQDDESRISVIGSMIAQWQEHGITVSSMNFIDAVDGSPATRRMERNAQLRAHALRAGEVALSAAFGTMVGAWLTRRRG